MSLNLYNSLTRHLEPFEPLEPPSVTLYSCGPTVYDNATIGNFRSYVFADTLKRVLMYNDYEVNHTINLTDFGHLTDDADAGEDKMIKALKREGKEITLANMQLIAEHYAERFKTDMDALNNLLPTTYTPASAYVTEQIELIETLVDKGYAYETSDGLYFDISRFPEYGKLGNVDIEKLREGARVSVNKEKRHPADFALWKKSDLGWESAWGTGFPGWHIECTAMVFATLGTQIDIHTGGEDHLGTHHNGEIAQAEAATGKKPYVRYWLHNTFITIDDRRIGKSEGNAITLSELKEKGYDPLVYRYWLLTAHYRSPVNLSFEALDGAKSAFERLQRFILNATDDGSINGSYRAQFLEYINDDLNTPKALALVWDLLKDEHIADEDKAATLRDFDHVLGLGLKEGKHETAASLGIVSLGELPEEVQTLVHERQRAREEKDFTIADRLREEIKEHGYLVEDQADGPRITRVKGCGL